MKTQFAIIFLVIISLKLFGQFDIYDNTFIKQHNISSINKWSINYNKIGNKSDSSLTIFIFDTNGRLIEERSEFNKDYSQFKSKKFTYNDKGYLINEQLTSPYHDGVYEYQPQPDSLETKEFEFSRLKTITQNWKNGKVIAYRYNYGELLQDENSKYYYFSLDKYNSAGFETLFEESNCRFAKKDKFGKKYCKLSCDIIDFIEIKTNNILTRIERYEYNFKN